MIPLRRIFEKEQKRLGVPWVVLEQDYVLSWVLFGIANTPKLFENLIFKGGTALKKCYFGEYRFSEDLDFSAVEGSPNGDQLERLFQHACDISCSELSNRIPNAVLDCNRYSEKKPHPQNQEAFVISAQLPWHRTPYTRVLVEITPGEKIVCPPVVTPVKHDYAEDFSCQIKAYSLEEIFAEKLRSILQNTKKIHERSWSRSRARDYYDLWRIFETYKDRLDFGAILNSLDLKCEIKDVSYSGIEDFFDSKAIESVFRDWDQWLAPLISPLPPCEDVLSALRSDLNLLFSHGKNSKEKIS